MLAVAVAQTGGTSNSPWQCGTVGWRVGPAVGGLVDMVGAAVGNAVGGLVVGHVPQRAWQLAITKSVVQSRWKSTSQ